MKISRRTWLIGSGVVAGGLALGWKMSRPIPNPGPTQQGSLRPDVWFELSPAGEVVLYSTKGELGQGVSTGLATILAEELDIEPDRVRVRPAGLLPGLARYSRTAASDSISSLWDVLGNSGAAGRALLLQAAGAQWKQPAETLTTEPGFVVHPDGRRAAYGDLASAAAALPGPVEKLIKRRDPGRYRWLGTDAARNDARAKSTGKAVYGIDVKVDSMVHAVVRHCPHVGGKVASLKTEAALKLRGVIDIFPIQQDRHIAVVADSHHRAQRAADALQVTWDKGPLGTLDSAAITKGQQQKLRTELSNKYDEGDTQRALGEASKRLESTYTLPFHAHMCMEPQNCTVHVRKDGADVWVGTQAPPDVQHRCAKLADLPLSSVAVHPQFAGGGFGRRGYVDGVEQCTLISMKVGKPVKLVWSREEDTRNGFFRPMTTHNVHGALDGEGKLTAWQHDLTGPSVFLSMVPDGIATMVTSKVGFSAGDAAGELSSRLLRDSALDPTTFSGTRPIYDVTNYRVNYAYDDPGIPVGFWRSVGHSSNCFVTECFMDELAHAAGQDPLAFRQQHLKDERMLRVLKQVASRASWGKAPEGRGQGIALCDFGREHSMVGYVAEVSVDEAGEIRLERITAAADVGRVINPNIVRQQIEGSAIWGATAALKPTITIREGGVVEGNFDTVPMLRMDEVPPIEVELIESQADPVGVGEPGVPPIMPAIANAVFALTGQRLRELPLRLS